MAPGNFTLQTSAILSYLLSAINFNYYYLGNAKYSAPLKHSSYDFIIVGGGTAGLVIAARLSEDARVRVLVLEAGGAGSDFNGIPLLAPFLEITPYIKFVPMTPQKVACGYALCSMLVGNALGGGSAHNQMVYLRGSPLDYDEWESVYGAVGWGYKDVLPFYIKSEGILDARLNTSVHGKTGPVPVTINSDKAQYGYPVLAKAWLEAAAEAGYRLGDYNSRDHLTFNLQQVVMDEGKRASTQQAFLDPIYGQRPNLEVLCFAEVTKILFEGRKAIGVQYLKDKAVYNVFASKEVILSAGAVGSPKLLQLSGIGDRRLLRKLGIPVILDAPSVGQGLQDHPHVLLFFQTNRTYQHPVTYQDLAEYWNSGTGLLSKNLVIGVGFEASSQLSTNKLTDSRLEYLFLINSATSPSAALDAFPMALDDYVLGKQVVFMLAYVIHPLSRGFVQISSSDFRAPVILSPNYLTEEQDMINLREVTRKAIQLIMNSQAFAELGANFVSAPLNKVCAEFILLSEAYIDCILKIWTTAANHVCCSVQMGDPSKNRFAVLTPSLRVRGVQSLRVIDASIMPAITRSNTNAIAIMIGEKGAAYIKKAHGIR